MTKKQKYLEAEREYTKNPSLSKLERMMIARNELLQEEYNNTKDDHRFKQGCLAESTSMTKLLIEAMSKRA